MVALLNVYLLCLDDISLDFSEDEDLLLEIPSENIEKIKRLFFREDRNRSLLALLLCKMYISKLFGIEKRNIFFKTDIYNKPYLDSFDDIHFNISHSDCLVAVAISNSPVGIDVEKIRKMDINQLKSAFSCNEQAVLHNLPPNKQRHELFKIWTMKESIAKYIGKGMHIPFNQISLEFAIGDSKNEYYYRTEGQDAFIYTDYLEDEYCLSICSQKEDECNISYVDKEQLIDFYKAFNLK